MNEPVYRVSFPDNDPRTTNQSGLLSWFPELRYLIEHFGPINRLEIETCQGVITIERHMEMVISKGRITIKGKVR